VPHLSQVSQPLNALLQQDTAWTWGPPQEAAFSKIKEMVSSTPVLAFYELGRPTLVSADASSYGMGGVIMQQHEDGWKPIAFCSRTLSESERRYAQIEKECLAGVWTCERFSRYLSGLPSFQLITDHKPLVSLINKKDLDQAPLRCQRLLIRMMRFSPEAVYTPGKNLVIADALSRNPLVQDKPDSDLQEEVSAHVAAVEATRPASPSKLTQIRDATKADLQLQAAMQYTQDGWPKYYKDVVPDARELFADRSQLSESDGLLTHGQRIVIPRSMREETLDRIHDGHLGLTKCRQRAQDSVWWPGITTDIRNKVERCAHCSINRSSQRKEPLTTTPLPDRPWQRIAADLCEIDGQRYLVVVDYFSRWLEIIHMTTTTCQHVIGKLKCMYARFGVHEQLVTDNGPQFTAHEFSAFATEYDFEHVTSSPYFAQSNGAAERAVQTAKSMLIQEDPFLALLTYRATPVAATGVSPAQLMMGRQIRSTIPVLPDTLVPEWPDLVQVAEKDRQAKRTYEHYYNKHHGVRPLTNLQPGDTVRVKFDTEKGWNRSGVVRQPAATPRSYIVETPNGSYRRNRRHLQQTATVPTLPNPPDSDDVITPPTDHPPDNR
jgi:transposase InsO family protein